MIISRAVLLVVLVLQTAVAVARVGPVQDSENCHVPIGVSNSGLVPSFWLMASDGLAFNGRLSRSDAWRSTKLLYSELKTAKKDPKNYAWLQVDLLQPTLVTGIQTRGDPRAANWVTVFSIYSSRDCETFSPVRDGDSKVAKFNGNYDRNSTVTNTFHDVLVSRCIKVLPLAIAGNITALRLELLGCDVTVCQEAVVEHLEAEMVPTNSPQSVNITDLVNDTETLPPEEQPATPPVPHIEPTIITRGFAEFKFPAEQLLFGIVFHSTGKVKGRRPRFIITYSRNCHAWEAVRERKGYGDAKVFLGYTGKHRTKMHRFPYPVRAQCVRIIPKTHRYISLEKPVKARFIGCGTGDGVIEQCGRQKQLHSRRKKRVVGGTPSDPNLWPWIASLQIRRPPSGNLTHVCGGSLVHPQFILTAAHCIMVMYSVTGTNFSRNFSDWNSEEFRKLMQVGLGEHSFSLNEGTQLQMDVEEVIIHPQYNITFYTNDVALLKLEKPVRLTDHVGLVCLPRSADQFNNRSVCRIIGWGRTRTGFPDLLHQGTVPLINDADCRTMYSQYRLSDDMMCAGPSDGSVDACVGDSGGPLVCKEENDQWYGFGIASWNIGCGRAGKPAVYAKVATFVPWIDEVIRSRSLS